MGRNVSMTIVLLEREVLLTSRAFLCISNSRLWTWGEIVAFGVL